MNVTAPHLNLVAAWTGILLGAVSGMLLGFCFHRENWLGGYGSLARRLYRLAHISFFGLALLNAVFYFTARSWPELPPAMQQASWLFVLGAITMPICCVVMAHWPRLHLVFAIPVASIVAAASLTLWEVTAL